MRERRREIQRRNATGPTGTVFESLGKPEFILDPRTKGVSVRLSPLLFFSALGFGVTACAASPQPEALKVEPGYTLALFQADVGGARSLAHGPRGTVFVGTRGKKVYAIREGKLTLIAKDLDAPNGIAFKGGDLYVGEVKRILKFPGIEGALTETPPRIPKPVVVFTGLPADGGHDWRYMRFGPDGALYLGIGAPCNICNREKDEPRFASILRFAKLDGSAPEIYARGIRNTVGFDWNPKTHVLWFTDNGRDWLGDDVPDDELDVAPKAGLHFGFPYCHAGTVPDPKLAEKRACSEFVPPFLKLGAHVAALGMRFLDAKTLLIAEHGSWNRSTKVGYRVMKVSLGGKAPVSTPFIWGFRTVGGKLLGRPVDLDIQADGSILVSDDQADAIYRVTKAGKVSGQRR
jgi:glucose/arabinose dehydrogenase